MMLAARSIALPRAPFGRQPFSSRRAPRPPRRCWTVAAAPDKPSVIDGWSSDELAGATGQSPAADAAAAAALPFPSPPFTTPTSDFDALPDDILGLILTAWYNQGDR